jgi:hypothetical protein
MSKGLEIRCYDYVNHPYEKVRDALRRDAINVFQEPPFGALGRAMNAVAGHRIAEASVHRFINDVADYLRKALVTTPR